MNKHVILLGLTVFAFAFLPEVFGDAITFRMRGEKSSIDVTADIVPKDNIDYVSLNAICEQIGAACAVQPARVQVDFQGKSGWIRTNDKQVNASLSTFLLDHPMLRQSQDALLAASDVEPFFQKAFGLSLARSSASAKKQAAPEEGVPAESEPPLSEIEIPESDRLGVNTVVLDPGHGGADNGVAGQSLKEKDLALAFAATLKKELESTLKLTVIMTRQDDKALSVAERADVANRSEAGLFISIHTGASYSPNASGFELFYTTPSGTLRIDKSGVADSRVASLKRTAKSKAVAEAVNASMEKAADSKARGVHEAPIRLFTGLSMPGVLIELGCLTNTGEEGLLQTDAYRNKLAKAIAAGIGEYIKGGNTQ